MVHNCAEQVMFKVSLEDFSQHQMISEFKGYNKFKMAGEFSGM
jgi:hypothetical protein